MTIDEGRNLYAIVLAAGKGKRMKSQLPKVLHKLGEKTLIDWVLDVVEEIDVSKSIVVVGFEREQVISHIRSRRNAEKFDFAVQDELLGTADAVKRALPLLPASGDVFVLCGDVPMLRAETLEEMFALHKDTSAAATILTAIIDDPTGYGRIVRDKDGYVEKIVEHRDASPSELLIKEINSGTYIFDLEILRKAILLVKNENAQKEFYLTDVIRIMRSWNLKISAISVKDRWEVEGVNSKEQLERMEKILNRRKV